MNPHELTSVECLDLFQDLIRELGTYTAQATARHVGGDERKRKWAMVRKLEPRIAEYKLDLMKRLGIEVPLEVRGRQGLIAIASMKTGKLCDQCKGTGGYRGKLLNFWTKDGMPLPLIQAMNGASAEKVKESAKLCNLWCPRCAVKLTDGAAKFTRTGKPVLEDQHV